MRLLLTTIFSLIFNITYYPTDANAGGLYIRVLSPEKEEVEENTIPELTVENVKKEIEKQGIKNSDVVLRQAILETGWFKCDNCSLGTNNLFGFFYKGKYLSFDNWVESVEYYKWWQDQLYVEGDYYDFLTKVGYATSPNYIKHLEGLKGAY